jgi:site-specific recombinase XerD
MKTPMANPTERLIPQRSTHLGAGVGAIAAISMPAEPKPKLLDEVRQAIRVRHYSPKTEDSYVHWLKRFILFHNKRHPAEMGEKEIAQFLSSLASELHVSASTQNQALNAILFLYRDVLRKDIGYVDGVIRAKKPRRLPVVLTKEEVKGVLGRLNGAPWLMSMLLYGAGLRLMECCRLRIKDIDFFSEPDPCSGRQRRQRPAYHASYGH